MTNPFKNNITKTLLILLVFLCFQTVSAHPPCFPVPCDEGPPGAPINGLVGIALVVGAYFGAKKLRANKRK